MNSESSFELTSAQKRNQNAADGGYWHQQWAQQTFRQWRIDPIGYGWAHFLTRSNLSSLEGIQARPHLLPQSKSDLRIELHWDDGRIDRYGVSAKMMREGVTDNPDARSMHHASRVKFQDAPQWHIMTPDNLDINAAILSHFVDGHPLSLQESEIKNQTLAWIQSQWQTIAQFALSGGPLEPEPADLLLISKAQILDQNSLSLHEWQIFSDPHHDCQWFISDSRLIFISEALRCIAQEPITVSLPKDGQLGTIGNSFMHLQRGQALSAGEQKDIQIKINAAALWQWAGLMPNPESTL